MRKYFGTDGFRGEANKVLTADHAYKIGRYLGWYYNQNHRGRIIIGKDTRRSSYMFEYALVAGITASGADAFFATCYHYAKCGICSPYGKFRLWHYGFCQSQSIL